MKKPWRKLGFQNHAVNEIIGTMLLLGISISLFSVVYYSVLSTPAPESTPSAQIIGSLDLDNNQIILNHLGGESITGNSLIIIHKGSITEQHTISTYTGKSWDMGEKIVIPIDNIQNTYVDAMIIDKASNSLISKVTLQKGTQVSLETYVNDIPETISANETNYIISASGTAELDNVSLYYRYSTDGGSTWAPEGLDGWDKWGVDESSLWSWNFLFGEGLADYEFISIGQYNGNTENWPAQADQSCTFLG